MSAIVLHRPTKPYSRLWHVVLLVALLWGWLWPGRSVHAASVRPELADLLAASDLVVRGQVVGMASFWNADHTLIESDVTLRVTDGVVGIAPPQVIIRTLGGYLPDEDLGMAASETAHFTTGAETLLFLRRDGDVYRVTYGERGQYEIAAQLAIHHPSGEVFALDALRTRIGALRRGEAVADEPLPTVAREPTFRPSAYVLSGQKWPGAAPMGEPFVINVNSVHVGGGNGTVDQFRNAILAAAAAWSSVPGAGFRFIYGGPTGATATGYDDSNEIVFASDPYQTGALAQAQWWFNGSGLIVEADMWFNDAYLWDATGAPGGNEFDVQSVAMHELGHWLSLGHDGDPAAVMFGMIGAGTLKRTLHVNDMAGVQIIYPAPIVPTATPTPVPTSTPTPIPPTATPTATRLPTHTPTPTPQNPIHKETTIRLWLPLLQR